MGETCFWSVTHAACWTMWNHSSASLCWPARRPAVLSEHALQAVSMLSQRANLHTAAFSIRSGFWRCVGFFFPIFQRRGRGEWRDQGDREAGLLLNVSCASHSAVQSVHRFISNSVLNHAHEDLLPVGDNLKKATVACGGKSNQSVFLTNELWDEEWLALFWLQVQS